MTKSVEKAKRTDYMFLQTRIPCGVTEITSSTENRVKGDGVKFMGEEFHVYIGHDALRMKNS